MRYTPIALSALLVCTQVFAAGPVANQAGIGWARQGKIVEAESAFKKALAIREGMHTPVHVDVAETLAELGSLYLSQQRYDQAEPLLQRALSIRKQLRPIHPDTRASEALIEELNRKKRQQSPAVHEGSTSPSTTA
jgi:tetratricopeptide (TPR) repeat protein